MKSFFIISMLGLFVILSHTNVSAQLTLQTYNYTTNQWENHYWVDKDVVKKSIDGQWANYYWYDSTQNVIKNSDGAKWVNYLWLNRTENTLKLAQNGQWVNFFWVNPQEPTVIKITSGGQWVNHFWLDGNVVKKSVNGAWENFAVIKGGTLDMLFLSALLYELNY